MSSQIGETKEWLWPCPHTTQITSGRNFNSNHSGLDIAAADIYGKPIIAARDGTISNMYIGCKNHNGKTTEIDCSTVIGCACNNTEDVDGVKYCNYGLGNAIYIKHMTNDTVCYSQYVHLSSIASDIVVNKAVKKGQVIGYVGSTGESTGPHLHFSLSTTANSNGRYNNNPDVIDYGTSVLVTFDPDDGADNVQYFGYQAEAPYGYLPEPISQNGYTFQGWYTNKNGQGTHITEACTAFAYSHTLYAKWMQQSITVTYKFNGGSYEGQTEATREVLPANGTISVDSSIHPVRNDGYRFAGWSSGGKTYQAGDTITGVTEAITLTAQWEQIYYKLTFQCENDEGIYNAQAVKLPGQTVVKEVPWGESCKIEYHAGKPYHKLIGWKNTTNNKVFEVGNTVSGVYSDHTLKAVFEDQYVYLTYQTGVPGVSLAPTKISYGDCTNGVIPNSMVQTPDYGQSAVFLGWTIKGDDSGTLYGGTHNTLPEFRSYTLTARTAPYCLGRITFDANEGENPPQTQTLYSGVQTLIPKEEPVRAAHGFNGWKTEAEGGTAIYAPGSLVRETADRTLYADWKGGGFTVRYDTGTANDDPFPAYDPPIPACYPVEAARAGITLPMQIPKRKGHLFVRWERIRDGGTVDTYSPGGTMYITDAYDSMGGNVITLTAVWERIYVTVNFIDPYNGNRPILTKQVGLYDAYGTVYDGNGTACVQELPAVTDGEWTVGWGLDGNRITAETPVSTGGTKNLYPIFITCSYEDVSPGNDNGYSWALSSIAGCRYYGYLTGTTDTTFEPGREVSRATAVRVLYRFAGSPVCGNNCFYDVKTASDEVSQAASWAKDNGIANGVGDYYFDTDTPVTRQQLVTMLYRYARLTGLIGDGDTYPDSALNPYTDKNDIGASAWDAMKWAVSEGVIAGTNETSLTPRGSVTRAQLAVFIIRLRKLLEAAGRLPAEYAEPVPEDEPYSLCKTLSDNSWEQISAASRAGLAPSCWSIGDEKSVTLSTGETVTLQIYGFDHDDLTEGGKAGITFGLKNILLNAHRMDSVSSNADSFAATELCAWLNGALLASLPDELRAVIRSADKKTSAGDGSGQFQTDSMKIFLFSEEECFGARHHSTGEEGAQYPIFTDDASRVKIQSGPHIIEWWERSPRRADSSSFCLVHSSGQAGYTSASWPYGGVCFGFCL